MMDFNNCLGRTCMKWSADGELTSVDLLFVLERLAQVDQEVSGLRTDSLDCQPCASISLRPSSGRCTMNLACVRPCRLLPPPTTSPARRNAWLRVLQR